MSAHAHFVQVAAFIDAHDDDIWADDMRTALRVDILLAIAKGAPEPARLAEIALGTGAPVPLPKESP